MDIHFLLRYQICTQRYSDTLIKHKMCKTITYLQIFAVIIVAFELSVSTL